MSSLVVPLALKRPRTSCPGARERPRRGRTHPVGSRAWEAPSLLRGHRRELPQAVPLACVVTLPLRVLALFLGRLARPHERPFDRGSQLAPLAIDLGASCRVRGADRK